MIIPIFSKGRGKFFIAFAIASFVVMALGGEQFFSLFQLTLSDTQFLGMSLILTGLTTFLYFGYGTKNRIQNFTLEEINARFVNQSLYFINLKYWIVVSLIAGFGLFFV